MKKLTSPQLTLFLLKVQLATVASSSLSRFETNIISTFILQPLNVRLRRRRRRASATKISVIALLRLLL